MKFKIAAAAALLAGAAVAASAQTPPTSSSAALAVSAAPAYVSPCPTAAIEAYSPIPNPETVRGLELSKDKKAFDAWGKAVKEFQDCKEKEFIAIDGEADALKARSPAQKQAFDYSAMLDAYDAAVAAEKKGGVNPMMGNAGLIPRGKPCPPAPALTAAPEPPPPVDDPKKADKKVVASATVAFTIWATPIYVYLQCAGKQINSMITEANALLEPIRVKKAAAVAAYTNEMVLVKAHNEKWNAFAAAYNKHLNSAPN